MITPQISVKISYTKISIPARTYIQRAKISSLVINTTLSKIFSMRSIRTSNLSWKSSTSKKWPNPFFSKMSWPTHTKPTLRRNIKYAKAVRPNTITKHLMGGPTLEIQKGLVLRQRMINAKMNQLIYIRTSNFKFLKMKLMNQMN